MVNIVLNDDVIKTISSPNTEFTFKCTQKREKDDIFYDCSMSSSKSLPNKRRQFEIYIILLLTSLFMFAAGWILIWSGADFLTELWYPSDIYSYRDQLGFRIPMLFIIFIAMIFVNYFIARKFGREPLTHQ